MKVTIFRNHTFEFSERTFVLHVWIRDKKWNNFLLSNTISLQKMSHVHKLLVFSRKSCLTLMSKMLFFLEERLFWILHIIYKKGWELLFKVLILSIMSFGFFADMYKVKNKDIATLISFFFSYSFFNPLSKTVSNNRNKQSNIHSCVEKWITWWKIH